MDRKAVTITALLVALILAKMALNLVASPARAVRADLAAELANVPVQSAATGVGETDFARLCTPILDKPSLWQELIAPPPEEAPAPVAPAAPNAPDLNTLLKELAMAPGQIGKNRMKVIAPGYPEGTWMAIGDTFNGCTLKSFTRESAVFSHYWEAGRKELTITIPRPLR